jgi:hypothetical protein
VSIPIPIGKKPEAHVEQADALLTDLGITQAQNAHSAWVKEVLD